MATMNAYCQIDKMPGECTEQNHKDWCVVLGFDEEIEYPFDFSSGVGTGEPRHSGVSIVKPIDTASPLLAHAAAAKEKIDKVVIELTRDPVGGGRTQTYYIITLEDVRVTKVKTYMPLDAAAQKQYPHFEEVTFCYRTIVWKHAPGSKETQYDFSKPTE